MAVTLQQAEVLRNQAVDLARLIGIENTVDMIAWSSEKNGQAQWMFEDGTVLALRSLVGGAHRTSVVLTSRDEPGDHTVYLAEEGGRDVQIFRPGRWIDHLSAWAEEVAAELARQRLEREAERAAELVEAFSPLDDWQPPADALAPEF